MEFKLENYLEKIKEQMREKKRKRSKIFVRNSATVKKHTHYSNN